MGNFSKNILIREDYKWVPIKVCEFKVSITNIHIKIIMLTQQNIEWIFEKMAVSDLGPDDLNWYSNQFTAALNNRLKPTAPEFGNIEDFNNFIFEGLKVTVKPRILYESYDFYKRR